MRRLGQAMAVLIVLAVSAGVTHASATPAQKCAVAKQKAAAKKISAKLKCWQKAIASGAASADPACLTAAETKFSLTIPKIEAKGGCVETGDAGVIEGAVDTCVDNIVALTPASMTTTTTTSSTTSTTMCVANGGTCTGNADCCTANCTSGSARPPARPARPPPPCASRTGGPARGTRTAAPPTAPVGSARLAHEVTGCQTRTAVGMEAVATALAPCRGACRPSRPFGEPAPFVTRWRSRTVANGDSMTFDVRRCFQCSAGKSKKVSSAAASFPRVVTAFGYLGPYSVVNRWAASRACSQVSAYITS